MKTRIHNLLLAKVARVLAACPELADAGCTVTTQTGPELAVLIQKEVDALSAPALVVSVDRLCKIHAKPVKWEVKYSVLVTEYVPLRETRADATTAVDAAMAAAEAIEAAGELGHLEEITHTTPEEGVLTATASFSGEFYLRKERK